MKSYSFLFFLFIFLISIIAGVIYFAFLEIQKILNQEESIPYKEREYFPLENGWLRLKIEQEPYIPFPVEINQDKG